MANLDTLMTAEEIRALDYPDYAPKAFVVRLHQLRNGWTDARRGKTEAPELEPGADYVTIGRTVAYTPRGRRRIAKILGTARTRPETRKH
jgi:hypothetical protein